MQSGAVNLALQLHVLPHRLVIMVRSVPRILFTSTVGDLFEYEAVELAAVEVLSSCIRIPEAAASRAPRQFPSTDTFQGAGCKLLRAHVSNDLGPGAAIVRLNSRHDR